MHKHRREYRQIDRRWAVVKAQPGSAYRHVACDVVPLRDLGGNHAVPVCEFGMTYLIQIDQHIDRDQCIVHNRRCPPLRIIVTDREEKHHVSIADRGLRIQEILLTFSAIYDSDCRLGADKSAICDPQSAIKGRPTSTSFSGPRNSCDLWAAPG